MRVPYNNIIADKIAKLERDELNLKIAQPTFAEGIVGYRYTGSFSIPINTQRYIVFRPKYPSRPAFVKMSESLNLSLFPIGIRSRGGVYVFPLPFNSYSDNTIDYALRSSQSGDIEITSTPPY